MNRQIVKSLSNMSWIFAAIIFLTATGVRATTHVVQFGGAVGFAYSPSSFTVTVGDTVMWEGDFIVHPLASTSVPATAQAFSNGSGPNFKYVVKVQGTYNFHCTIHLFTGTFTASQSSVKYLPSARAAVGSNEVRFAMADAHGLPTISLDVPHARQVTIRVFDLSGREQATIMDRVVSAGTYSIPLGPENLARGLYFVKLSGVGESHVVSFFKAN